MGSGPKGPMSCRTQGGISIRPSVRPSVLPSPPVGHQGLKFALPALNLALQASNQPSRLQISPPRLKSDLQTSDLPSRPSIRPPSIKSALCGSNLPSKPQIHSQSLNSALQPSNMPSLAWISHLLPEMCLLRTYGNSPLCSTGHRPFGAAALLSLHFYSWSLLAGHRVPLTMCDPWMTSFLLSFLLSFIPSFFPNPLSFILPHASHCQSLIIIKSSSSPPLPLILVGREGRHSCQQRRGPLLSRQCRRIIIVVVVKRRRAAE